MGEVVELGADNKKLKGGDRVVVPFTISCGECFFCQRGYYSGCERSKPNRPRAEKSLGAIRPPAFSVIPTYLADTAADKQNSSGCLTQM